MVAAVVPTGSPAAGPVSFAAPTAPRPARCLTRAPGPNLLPSPCRGAAPLVTADRISQRAFGAERLPAGVVTGVLGGACLLWLLVTGRRAGRI
ncbi:iron chelate uptake ABC transporter family permease subunit [Streptomyces sp. RG38]|uniref:Iron chelate uptake ABC transporter family permease subunit n=1 Tax=Streptomyces tagetis TaxID=2820809 RepID=A0A940XLX1_9ACTN|nr:iron chelate uptake ABC transporter family permease subunit [Streptomyces sp. RG38]